MKSIILLAMAFALSGCNPFCHQIQGSGVSKTESRTVGSFDEIDFGGSARLEVTVGAKESLQITGDDNLVPLLKTRVEGHRLVIDQEDSCNPKTPLVIRITTPSLKEFDLSGAGDAVLRNVKSEKLHVKLSGAADIEADGQISELELDLSGAGSADLKDLTAKNANIGISGAGSVDLTVTDTLDASVSGAGSVTYGGDPKTVNKEISGAGSISPR